MGSNGEDKNLAFRAQMREDILEVIPEGVRGVIREELRNFLDEFKDKAAVRPLPNTGVGVSSSVSRRTQKSLGPTGRAESGQSGAISMQDTYRSQTQSSLFSGIAAPAESEAENNDDIDVRTRMTFAEQFKNEGDEATETVKPSLFNARRIGLWEWTKHAARKFYELEEPQREGLLARLVLSKPFEAVAAWVIVFNCAFMVYAANAQVEDPDSSNSNVVISMEMFFLCFYTLEVVLKLCVHRLYFFWNLDLRWNILDLCLVIYGYFDIAFRGRNFSWLRSLRLFKMAKVLRVLRIVRSLKELRLILSCLMSSILNLIWSIVMIAVIVFMFSLIFVQEAAQYLGEMSPEEREEAFDGPLYADFGSVERSMLSLYAAATGGQDWQMFYFALQPTGIMSCSIFLFFIAFIQIALVNILTGIFVEKALKRAMPDRQTQARELVREVSEQRDELRKLCEKLDDDEDNTISPKEFYNHRAKRLKEYLKLMGLDGHDVKALFELLSGATADKKVHIDVFVKACMRLRTGASVDMQRLMCEWSVMMGHVRQIEGHLQLIGSTILEERGHEGGLMVAEESI